MTERNQENSVYVGNLDERVHEALVWELMIQAGPVVNVHLPKDRISQAHQGYGFVEFLAAEDADYAIKIMNMVKLYGKAIRVNKATADRKEFDIGANLFVGNLDPDVDEKTLLETFSSFGKIIQPPKISREPATGASRGYGFLGYDSFEAADAAIEAMNNRFLANKPISVSYAMKKDGKGELHGSGAERLLAKQAQRNAPDVAYPPGQSTPIPANIISAIPPVNYAMPGAQYMHSYSGTPPVNFQPYGQPPAVYQQAPPPPPPRH